MLVIHPKWKPFMALLASINVISLSGQCAAFTSLNSQRTACLTRCNSIVESSTKTPTEIGISELNELNNCKSGTQARKILDSLYGNDENTSSLYSSVSILPGASEKGISDADLAIQTRIRNNRYTIMELIELNGNKDADRASLGLFGVMVASVSSALVANQNLPGPEIIRFLVVWLLSFAPLAFVGAGIATPEKLQTLLISIQRNVFPSYRKRTIQHEAGHFLMGHLLGLPVKGYAANSIKNAVEFYPLNDPDIGRDRASQLGFNSAVWRQTDETIEPPQSNEEVPYFSREGRGGDSVRKQSVFRKKKDYDKFLKLPSLNEPSKAWPYQGFDELTIDKLAVVSVAGVCAEILAFGNAEGGFADFSQLRSLFSSAELEMEDKDMDNRIRFALGFTMTQLRLHLGVLDDLTEAMERGASVAECINIIETCPNVRGGDGIVGDYDIIRRKKFEAQGMGLLEKILFGGKNADVEEDRRTTGIGGGRMKKSFAMTGDDPFYAAIAIAFLFFVWASNGGLALH